MLSFLSVWIGVFDLLLAGGVAYAWLTSGGGPAGPDRPLSRWLVGGLYLAALGLTLAILSLWANRKEDADTPGVKGQRTQAIVAIVLCLAGVAVLYVVALMGRRN